ncbi:MAG TPA: sigma-70 family RNA polymerase sigma factor [Gemmataceae bacterium]|nr:sigma-70 family RNA polymerase sigma factor [Gemmataceae bacterium]
MAAPHDKPDSGGRSPSPAATSRSLLDRARADDAAAWDRLVGLYAPLVLHWCRRWGLREEDAADVFQEVFQAVATHLAGFRKEAPGDTFRGWLRTITHNKVRDHFRRRGREPGGVGGSEAQRRLAQIPAPPEEESADDERAEQGLFHRALELIRGEFEERTWQAFWRTAVEGGAAHDVAAELGMSPGAVRVAKSRVLQRLREELGDLQE